MRNRTSDLRGYSLIEVLVVVGIVVILSSIVLLSMNQNRVARQLEANAREVVALLRMAQNYALTGRQVETNTLPCIFDVQWNGNAYASHYYSRPFFGAACAQTSQIVRYELKYGVVFQTASTVQFRLPHGVPNVAARIVLTKAGQCRTVSVSSTGLIVDQPGC